jgi:hypothetical protein
METINFQLLRYSDDGESSLGLLHELKPIDNPYLWAFTLEDEKRVTKLKGETRIWGNLVYELKIREELTELTKKYRADKRISDFFEYHIEIVDVRDFTGVYVHIGNKDIHTDACLLLGNKPHNNNFGDGFIEESVDTYRRWYTYLYPKLKAKTHRSFIKVIDENKLNILL